MRKIKFNLEPFPFCIKIHAHKKIGDIYSVSLEDLTDLMTNAD